MIRCSRQQRKTFQRGFTLLEVLLALGLSVLLLAAIALAVDFHLRLLDTGRAEVEQAQLARAILRRIADDLRNSIQYTPSTSMSTPTDSTEMTTGDDTIESPDRTSNLANASSLPALPGVYGNDRELQIDVSRLPRLDQMQTLLAAQSTTTSPTPIADLRTVTYFASNPSGGSDRDQFFTAGSGLIRRDIDRATATLALQQGETLQTQGDQDPLAPEVEEIQFRYFDGTNWVDQWDTTERSGLPMAVQIGIWLARPQQSSRRTGLSTASGLGGTSEEPRMYQLLVHLPAARPTTDSSTTAEPSQ